MPFSAFCRSLPVCRSAFLALLLAFASALAPPIGPERPRRIGFRQRPPPPLPRRCGRDGSAEFEAYIRTAEIDRFEDVPIGVTRPKRAFLKPGGLVASIAWKVLPPSRQTGYWESYKSEIAAYELDKLLGMTWCRLRSRSSGKGRPRAAILWVSPVRQWKEVQDLPKPVKWNRQAILMKMFDNLIGNPDRNMGNLIVDDDWNLFLIDHSRAFIDSKDLPVKMERIDRDVWNRMLALDEPSVTAALGHLAGQPRHSRHHRPARSDEGGDRQTGQEQQ